jgi:hypothetical protein
MNHARQTLVLTIALVIAAAIYALAPHHRPFAAAPFALKVLAHGGLAVRDRRRRNAAIRRFHGKPTGKGRK